MFRLKTPVKMLGEDEWKELVNKPFNPPDPDVSDDDFQDEFFATEEALRKVLLNYGEEDDYGEKDFGLGSGVGRTRGIGVELGESKGLEKPAVVKAVREFLGSLPTEYDVCFQGMNYDFYLYVSRERITAYTEDLKRLGRFGFKPG